MTPSERVRVAADRFEMMRGDRDAEIRAAVTAGVSAVDVAAAAGMSRQRVYQIISEGRTEEES